MSSRRLSLHPSALSDAEHALFTASLADLADVDVHDGTTDWERISVSVREARAWVCGRYPGLGAGRVDEVCTVFSGAPHSFLSVLCSFLPVIPGFTCQSDASSSFLSFGVSGCDTRKLTNIQMLHLFPAPTFGGGAFFALLRLVLHTQAGTPIDRSLAFVQGTCLAVPVGDSYLPLLPPLYIHLSIYSRIYLSILALMND
jgi:hypothetical protein